VRGHVQCGGETSMCGAEILKGHQPDAGDGEDLLALCLCKTKSM